MNTTVPPQGPRDSAIAAQEAFAAIANKPFPNDIFSAPHLRWGVVGCGVIARQMATSMALAGRTITAVTNRTQSKAQAFADEYHIERVYATPDELFSDPQIDAIYITTPHNTHIEYLLAALRAHKHVLCEKAITLNSEELAQARDAAQNSGCVLMDATTILHMPLYRHLLDRVQAGAFGKLNLAQLNFGSFKPYGDLKNRFYNPALAGGAMLDIGVYALSLARLFMSEQPQEVFSVGNLATTGVDETGALILRNSVGQIATITMSLHSKLPKRAVLSFEDCFIEIDEYPRADTATITWTATGEQEVVHCGTEGYALCYEIADLERAVAGDTSTTQLLDITQDVMTIMTDTRRAWGVCYPEEQ